jgi:predicted transglutaminase-like cysteine proteinase
LEILHLIKTFTLLKHLHPFYCLLTLMLLALSTAILLPAAALDMTRLQATMHNLGGNPQSLIAWQKLLQDHQESPAEDKLQRVNEFFNRRIEFGTDPEIWGQSDYWATPMETLAKGKGDCEDYVIAKYFTLLNMNIPDTQLRLIYVKARIGGPGSNIQQAHMVLAYYASPDAEPLVLDNLITEIRPAARRLDLQPIFSFNSQGIFAGVAANATLGPGGTVRLTRWQDLLQRARREGLN